MSIDKTFNPISRRRRNLFGAGLSLLLTATCHAKPMTVTLDLVLFSYLRHPIFDVFIDGKGGDSSGVFPETGGSTISGVQLTLGPKHVTWRLDGPEGAAGNGQTIVAKNFVQLLNIQPNSRYLALHIYPDNTIELLTSQYYPQPSPRGEVEIFKLRNENTK